MVSVASNAQYYDQLPLFRKAGPDGIDDGSDQILIPIPGPGYSDGVPSLQENTQVEAKRRMGRYPPSNASKVTLTLFRLTDIKSE